MTIERIEEARLSKADDAQITKLLADSFTTDFGNRSFFIQRPHIRLIKRQAATIIGHCGLFLRAIRIGDALKSIYGLGDVAVSPNARKQGIGAELVNAAIAEAKTANVAFLLLFGDAPIYTRAGFKPAPNRLIWIDMDGASTATVKHGHHDKLMMLEIPPHEWNNEAEIDLLGHAF